MRRKSKVDDAIERYSNLRAVSAIERADVCLILIDANEGVTEQDTKVAGLAHEAGKASIIVVNKWDAVEKDTNTMNEMTNNIRRDLSYMTYAPVVFISALTGQRVDKLFEMINAVYEPELHAHHDRHAQQHSGRRDRARPAAHGQGPPPEDLLYDAGRREAAALSSFSATMRGCSTSRISGIWRIRSARSSA